jgi:IstB-like ATP binding protein
MSAVVHARVVEQLTRLRLRYVAERLDALLNDAARTEPTYLDFLDSVLRQEVDAKQRTRVAMGLKIAHFPTVKTLDEFEFKFQPSVDQRLVRELATGRFLTSAENVLNLRRAGRRENASRDRAWSRHCRSRAHRALHECHRPARGPGESRNRGAAGRAAAVLQQAEAPDHR